MSVVRGDAVVRGSPGGAVSDGDSGGVVADGESVVGGKAVVRVVRTDGGAPGSRLTIRWRRQVVSSRSGRSSRQWQPRVSSRSAAAAATSTWATRWRLVVSQVSTPGSAGLPSGRASRPGSSRASARRRWRAGARTEHPGALGHDPLDRGPWRARGGQAAGSAGGRRRRSPARRPGVGAAAASDVGGDPLGEDQALQQGVGREPVGAVHAGAGDLATGVEARHGGAAVQVGADAAARRSARRARPGSAR